MRALGTEEMRGVVNVAMNVRRAPAETRKKEIAMT
jgi:hypothetical protein